MTHKIKSILDELDSFVPNRDRYLVIESRADHFINSGINLIRDIEESFSPKEAEELTRRLFNSLKGRDFSKFERKIRQLKESEEKDISEDNE